MRQNAKVQNKRNMLILAAVAMLGVAYGIWIGVCEPLQRNRAEMRKQAEALEGELRVGRSQIRQIGDMKAELLSITEELQAVSDRYLLHPRLGNYLLQARESMSAYAKMAGVGSIQVDEIGLVDLPQPPKAVTYLLRGYGVRVGATCGYRELVEWIRVMETANPYLSVNRLEVAAQPSKPRRHAVQFEVQWPVWVDPDMRETVRQKAADIAKEYAP